MSKSWARFVCSVLAWCLVFAWWVGGQAMAADEPTTTAPATTAPVDAPTTTAPATTDTTVADAPSIDVATGGEGIDGMVPGAKLREPTDIPTLTERFPPGAYTWDGSWGKTDVVNQAVQFMLADPGLQILVGWGVLVTRTMTWVWSIPAIGTDVVDNLNHVLRDNGAWIVWATALIVVTGFYGVYLGLRQRALEAISHIGWVLTLGVLGVAFMWLPGATINSLNHGTTNLSRWTLATVATADPGGQVPDGTVQQPTFNGDAAVGAVRRAQDVWWRLFVVIPWATGELGSTTVAPPGTIDHILALKSGDVENLTPDERKVMEHKAFADCGGTTPIIITLLTGQARGGSIESGAAGVACMRKGEWNKYRDDVLEQLPGVDAWINGKKPLQRAGVAWAGLLVAIPSGILMIGLSLAIVWWQVTGVFRLILFPVYALRGMAPVTGPKVFARYAQVTAATFVKRIAAGGLLALVLIIQTVVSITLVDRGWVAMAAGQVLATAGIIVLWVQHRRESLQPVVPRIPYRQARDSVRAQVERGRNLGRRAALLPHVLSPAGLFDAAPARKTGRVREKVRPETPPPAGSSMPLPRVAELRAGPPVVREAGPVPRPVPQVWEVGPARRATAALPPGPAVHPMPNVPRPVGPVIDVQESPTPVRDGRVRTIAQDIDGQ